jgi:hypothetical protein
LSLPSKQQRDPRKDPQLRKCLLYPDFCVGERHNLAQPRKGLGKINAQRATFRGAFPATLFEMRHRLDTSRKTPRSKFQARFDGLEYAVTGSTAADTITYSASTPTASPDEKRKDNPARIPRRLTDCQTRTATYSIHGGDRIVANGIAVFERSGSA